jgi:cysteine desulfurase
VLAPVRELERRGAGVTWLAVDDTGRIDPASVAAALRPNTALVCVGWANNEIGTVQPIAAIGTVCRRAGLALHVDAAQALGKIAVDVASVDLCALSAHKLGGPVGVGALFVRRGVALSPLALGGEQERGRRPGTENVAGIVGFAAAVEGAPLDERTAALRERLWSGLAEIDGVRRYSPRRDCLPNTLHVGFAGVAGEALVAALDLEGVAVSVGSACAAGSGEPSHVLLALGCTPDAARSGVRFSLGPETTSEEIDGAVAVTRRVLEQIRAASPMVARPGTAGGPPAAAVVRAQGDANTRGAREAHK